ncbi:hypothetical protein DVH24_033353, partial [Malus domestica]
YPRSSSQAIALKELGFKPDLFVLIKVIAAVGVCFIIVQEHCTYIGYYLEEALLHILVPEDILVERVVGRRLDPITGKIYHLKYSPPETQEIASRLTQCFDDTEEKVKLRLNTHHQNVEAVLSLYEGITTKASEIAIKHSSSECGGGTFIVKLLLNTHHQNVEAINGSVTKEDVFAEIDSALTRLVEKRKATWESLAA